MTLVAGARSLKSDADGSTSSLMRVPSPADTDLVALRDRFRILSPLAPGDLGPRYKGHDLLNGSLVRIGRIYRRPLSTEQQARIQRRLRLVRMLKHPAVLSLLAVQSDEDAITYVEELPGNRSFGEWIASREAAPVRILEAILQVATAIESAHRLGVYHGNLSLATIGWKDDTGQPCLELTATNVDLRQSGPEPLPPAESTADVADFCRMLRTVTQDPAFSEQLRHLSAIEHARLRRLIGESDTENAAQNNDINDLVGVLRALFLASLDQSSGGSALSSPDTNDRTSELPPDAGTLGGTVVLTAGTETSLSDANPANFPSSAESASTRELRPGSRLGRFVIEQKLGEGGMGAVFRARDIADSTIVAVRVLSRAAQQQQNSLRRFRKEARLLAALNNPWITNLIEVNEDGGLWYIVLEFVDGRNLKSILAQHGPLPEKVALAVIADVARALVDAHQQDIVHRDIKPENILLEGWPEHGWPDDRSAAPEHLRVRLADFGIAPHVDQSQSLQMTHSGGLPGTPLYMSPEQFRDAAALTPQSDIYSLGATLFELLTGHPPFYAADPITLGGKHCFEAPPTVRGINDQISETADRMVQRCLAKHVSERYADAGHLLREIDHHLRGQPSPVALHPVLPPAGRQGVVSSIMTWDLDSTPEELWPYVSNTERLNRAIGLPPVKYSTCVDPQQVVHRFGEIQLAGLTFRWEEHPFEWIEGRRMSVLRQFGSGPFDWFVSTVELERLSTGKTRLYHTVKIAPRHWAGRQLARIETGRRCRRALEKVYLRIDETLRNRLNGRLLTDPFEPAASLTRHQRLRIEERAERLTARGVSPELTSALANFLATAAPQEVARIRPIDLARRLAWDETDVLNACLLASSEGLLQLLWNLLCPACGVAADTRETLRQLAAHGHCAACDQNFSLDPEDAVELIFRAHPDLRDGHVGTWCIGGPGHAPHVVAQLCLEPRERLELDLNLSRGDYLIRGPRLPASISLRIQSGGAPSQMQLILNSTSESSRSAVLRDAGQLITLENDCDVRQLVRLERTIPRDNMVTAARAVATPGFRELFPDQILRTGRMISTENVTFLVTAVTKIDEVYAAEGDAAACRRIEKQADLLRQAVRNHRGEVVRTIGDRMTACFEQVTDAVKTAFQLQSLLEAESLTSQLRLAVGVHRGPAIVTTVNGRLDYSGLTTRQALKLPDLAGPGILLTEPVFADGQVDELLAAQNRHSALITADLPGRSQQVIRIFE